MHPFGFRNTTYTLCSGHPAFVALWYLLFAASVPLHACTVNAVYVCTKSSSIELYDVSWSTGYCKKYMSSSMGSPLSYPEPTLTTARCSPTAADAQRGLIAHINEDHADDSSSSS